MVKSGESGNDRNALPGTAALLLAGYSAALACFLVLTAPAWLGQMRRGGKYREGWRERLGQVPARLRAPAPGENAVWLHAVSVGEVLAAAPLIARLRVEIPRARVFVSTTTQTAQRIARARFGPESVFYFPADFAFSVRRWLDFLQPKLCVLVESEFWPRMLFEAAWAHVPVAVVNGRVSSRSWPRYRRLRALWRPLLGTLALAQAQSEVDAERLQYIGARAQVGGNLKYDLRPARATPLLGMLQEALPAGVPVLVCGSTLEDEEDFLLSTLPIGAMVLLAPRHPERFDAVANVLAQGTRPWVRLSEWRLAPLSFDAGTVMLLDSVGELAGLYVLATVAIVGGGFLHAGGHNPLEPAMAAKPVVIGPGYENFVDIVTTLVDAKAVAITDLPHFRADVDGLLADPETARAMGARGELVCRMYSGATERAVRALSALVSA